MEWGLRARPVYLLLIVPLFLPVGCVSSNEMKRPFMFREAKLTDPATGSMHEARLTILTAIGRTEIGDQIRRCGGCHNGAGRAAEFSEDTDVEMLVDGLRRLADISDDSTLTPELRARTGPGFRLTPPIPMLYLVFVRT